MAAGIEMARVALPDAKLTQHVIELFEDASAHSRQFTEALMQSRITLCPRGGSLETYRFFEAMRCGTIPIIRRLPDRDFYSGSPAITIRHWADLPSALDRLLGDPGALEARHRAVLDWWGDHCSPTAAARTLAAALDLDPTLPAAATRPAS
jgi:hypothetical protein